MGRGGLLEILGFEERKERYFIGGGSGGAEEGGGGCAGVVCRIVPVAPQAQAGLIPFTADSRP